MTNSKTIVNFRKSEDSLIAILPEHTYAQQYRKAYLYESGTITEVGVDIDLITENTKKATKEEYAEFKRRLEDKIKLVLEAK